MESTSSAAIGSSALVGSSRTKTLGWATNALAIADGRPFEFRFGPNSRRLHLNQSPEMTVVERIRLSADIDTPDDLIFAREQGFTG